MAGSIKTQNLEKKVTPDNYYIKGQWNYNPSKDYPKIGNKGRKASLYEE